MSSSRMVLWAGCLCLLTAPAWAQTGPIVNGQQHQPTREEVQSREKAVGVAPTQAQRSHETAGVDRTYRKLLGQPRPAKPIAPPCQGNACSPPARP